MAAGDAQPTWVEHHPFDVFHVQFGFDAWDPAVLSDLVDAVHEQGRPFVHTVHDLRNPHHASRDLHDAQLTALLAKVDEVITLTAGAAAEIARRFGREAQVSAAPRTSWTSRPWLAMRSRRARATGASGSGCTSRACARAWTPLVLLPPLVRAVRDVGGVLQVNGHRDVLEPSGVRYDARLSQLLRQAAQAGDLELHVHDFFDDAAPWRYLARWTPVSCPIGSAPTRVGWRPAVTSARR